MAETWSNDDLFRWFVLQQQQMVMIHLGKLVHPVTGKIERDLDTAKMAIDLLGMLKEKTSGNLLPDDDRLISQVLTTLRLNFVEESARPSESTGQAEGAPDPTGSASESDPGEPSGSGEAKVDQEKTST